MTRTDDRTEGLRSARLNIVLNGGLSEGENYPKVENKTCVCSDFSHNTGNRAIGLLEVGIP